jgi:hypothetical protein
MLVPISSYIPEVIKLIKDVLHIACEIGLRLQSTGGFGLKESPFHVEVPNISISRASFIKTQFCRTSTGK